jgi:sec-independent protein translocase protein TatA
MGSMSIWHWVIVIAVVLLLFGRGKISELMGDVAQGIKAFKKGMTEDEAAKAETNKTEPVKTIDHQAAGSSSPPVQPVQQVQPQTEPRKVG